MTTAMSREYACALITQAFIAFLTERGVDFNRYGKGYDHEEGEDYANLIRDFIHSLNGKQWRVQMEWGLGTSELIAYRPLSEFSAQNFWTRECYALTGPLNTEEEHEDAFDSFSFDVFKLLDQSGELDLMILRKFIPTATFECSQCGKGVPYGELDDNDVCQDCNQVNDEESDED